MSTGDIILLSVAGDVGKTYRFLEEIALADVGFVATGDSVSELFVAAASAVIEAMVNPVSVGTNWTREVRLSQEQVDDLLFDWLNTIVFLKDAEAVVFRDVHALVSYDSDANLWHLSATLIGDHIDANRQELRTDVKAVTKHLYEVKEKEGTWSAHVVVDV